MIIKKMVVEDFMSFYGRNVLSLERGLNFVVGSNGSGKTNLVRAFCFAVARHTVGPYLVPLNQLINRKRRDETPSPSCRVEVEIEDGGRNWHAQSSLSLVGERVIQSSALDLGLDETAISGKLKRIVIDSEIAMYKLGESMMNWSASARSDYIIRRQLDLNLKAGIKMAILDGALAYLESYCRHKILKLMTELPMEQVTIMVNMLPDNAEDYPCTIHQIEHDSGDGSSRIADRVRGRIK